MFYRVLKIKHLNILKQLQNIYCEKKLKFLKNNFKKCRTLEIVTKFKC